MTQTTGTDLPKYFKDASGYCYIATPLLAQQAELTPWDGAINAAGYAVEEQPAPVEKPASKAPIKPAAKRAAE